MSEREWYLGVEEEQTQTTAWLSNLKSQTISDDLLKKEFLILEIHLLMITVKVRPVMERFLLQWFSLYNNKPSFADRDFLIQSVKCLTKSKKKSPSGTLITCTQQSCYFNVVFYKLDIISDCKHTPITDLVWDLDEEAEAFRRFQQQPSGNVLAEFLCFGAGFHLECLQGWNQHSVIIHTYYFEG